MADNAKRCINVKKRPKQTRSEQLMESVLEAAVQVLKKEGAARFTTARVAERAGVSIGSLYQYFPNKAAILFQLQLREWLESARILGVILSSPQPPLERLRLLIEAFVSSECTEANVRRALSDAAPLYRDNPEARKAREDSDRLFDSFLSELMEGVNESQAVIAGNLIISTLTSVGKDFSREPHSQESIDSFAKELADMLCNYVKTLRKR